MVIHEISQGLLLEQRVQGINQGRVGVGIVGIIMRVSVRPKPENVEGVEPWVMISVVVRIHGMSVGIVSRRDIDRSYVLLPRKWGILQLQARGLGQGEDRLWHHHHLPIRRERTHLLLREGRTR